MKFVKYIVLLFLFSSCGKYDVKHYGCDDSAINERFTGGYFFMPNIFTPNADAIDDFLTIYFQGATNINIKIKNHLDEVVFQKDNMENSGNGFGVTLFWDGKVKKVITDSWHTDNYHYELSFTTPDGAGKVFQGRLTSISSKGNSGGSIELGCIDNIENCVFSSQWVADSLPLIPVDSSIEYKLYYGSCK